MMRRAILVLLALALLLWALIDVSPRPAIAGIRWLFDRGAAQTGAALVKHLPPGVQTLAGQTYRQDPTPLGFDLHRPAAAAGQALPLMVWIHGGAFVSGRKEDVAHYVAHHAAGGMAVASLDYTLAPAATYPTQLREVNQAVAHLLREAGRLGIDPTRVLLAGDSAGAQLAAQLAAVSTDPAYARAVGIDPALAPGQLRGVLLFCGVYDFAALPYDGVVGVLLRAVARGFLGARDFRAAPGFEQASVVRHVGAAFPPAFIAAGNGDPLLPQSQALAARLQAAGVAVETVFHPPGLVPPLGHEYQFDLDRAEGRDTLERAIAFALQRLR